MKLRTLILRENDGGWVRVGFLFTAGDLFAPPAVCLLAPLGCSGTSWRWSSLTVRTAMAEVNDELGFGLFELFGLFLELLTLRTFPFLAGNWILPVVSQLEFQMRFVVEVVGVTKVPRRVPSMEKSLEPWFSNRFWWVTNVGALSEVFGAVQESTSGSGAAVAVALRLVSSSSDGIRMKEMSMIACGCHTWYIRISCCLFGIPNNRNTLETAVRRK